MVPNGTVASFQHNFWLPNGTQRHLVTGPSISAAAAAAAETGPTPPLTLPKCWPLEYVFLCTMTLRSVWAGFLVNKNTLRVLLKCS